MISIQSPDLTDEEAVAIATAKVNHYSTMPMEGDSDLQTLLLARWALRRLGKSIPEMKDPKEIEEASREVLRALYRWDVCPICEREITFFGQHDEKAPCARLERALTDEKSATRDDR